MVGVEPVAVLQAVVVWSARSCGWLIHLTMGDPGDGFELSRYPGGRYALLGH